ncbi:RNAse P Rpr2/Rpp21/SNM1 subunit domain-containing protein [Peziza echinospora]|nr:RNAse P Rpr2/Rpp21/SNM1 subunit domain-containing protein [Peziza echinospora]
MDPPPPPGPAAPTPTPTPTPPTTTPTPTTTTATLRPRPQQPTPKTPKPPPLPRTSFLRLSHLYQLSHSALPHTPPLARFYLSTMRSLSHKSVLRLAPSIKRSICKRCDSLLVPGVSCAGEMRNDARGGSERKPWADVWVVRCNGCGAEKRFPVGQGERGGGRGKKGKKGKKGEEDGEVEMKDVHEAGDGGDDEDPYGGYTLWSEREDVVIPDIVDAGNSGGGGGAGGGP